MNDLYKLKYIIRYSNAERVNNEDVAQHSFYVSVLVIQLHQEFPKANLGRMLFMSTIHDWPEAEIDDVAHSVKRDYPAVARALKSAERKVIKQYSKNVQEAFLEYEDGTSLEASIVKLADIMQCIQYLESEVALGNTTVQTMLDESIESHYKQKEKVNDIYQRLHS